MASAAQHSQLLQRESIQARNDADAWQRAPSPHRTSILPIVTDNNFGISHQTIIVDHQHVGSAHVSRRPGQWLDFLSKIIREAIADAHKRATENDEDVNKTEIEREELLDDINGYLMDLNNTFWSFDPVGYADFHNIHGERRRKLFRSALSETERIAALLNLGTRCRAHNPIDEAVARRRSALLDNMAKQSSSTRHEEVDELHMLNVLHDLHSNAISKAAFLRDHCNLPE